MKRSVLWEKHDLRVEAPRLGSHQIIAGLVGSNQRCLELGIASGRLASELRKQGCGVIGLDIDERGLRDARKQGFPVILGDVTALPLGGHLKFDVVVLGDVIEHLSDPWSALRHLRPYLADHQHLTRLIVSVPNIAYWRVRLHLMSGRFEYTERGILDRTHLRFFTRDTLLNLLGSTGYRPLRVVSVSGSMGGGGLRGRLARPALLLRPTLFTFQWVVECVPHRGSSG